MQARQPRGLFMRSDSSFCIRLPFVLQPTRAINGLEQPLAFSVGSYSAQLQAQGAGYLLTLKGFPSEPAAADFVPNIWSGLATLTAQGSACSASFAPSNVTRLDDPTLAGENFRKSLPGLAIPGPVHGFADAEGPVVYREDEKVLFFGAGNATFRIGVNPVGVISDLARGLLAPNASAAYSDPRFRTAVDLYVASYYEASATAQLLISAMVLEVIAPPAQKHVLALAFLDQWDAQLVAQLQSYLPGTEETEALQSLRREVCFRREQSIRSRIRGYVTSQLGEAGVPNAQDLGLKARRAYDVRSTLAHEGRVDESEASEALAALRQLVPALIRIRLGLAHGLPATGAV